MLKDEMPRHGAFLFRWRSYLPLVLVPLVFWELIGADNIFWASNNFRETWSVVCLCIVLAGISIRCITTGYAPKGTSGRNTREQVAEQLNTTGIYSTCRNPLYLGNLIILSGIILMVGSWEFFLIVLLAFILYYERIIFAEEEFLENKFGETYRNWASKTPFLIPSFSYWRKPDIKFNWKRVIKKELYGITAAVSSMFFINVAGDYFARGHLKIDLFWWVLFVVTIILFFFIRILKKSTNILSEK